MSKQLTRNFSLAEMLNSQTASRLNIQEQYEPSELVIENLRQLSIHVLQPLRDMLRRPVFVSSGYRSPRVNRIVGGADSSQHMKGQAADIVVPGMSAEVLFQKIRKSDLLYDQLIQEFGRWVHVSYNPEPAKNRKEALRAVMEGGRVRFLRGERVGG
ncbi:D-Ala-D-Ala carboxypeptidase family metallohydrolase [Cecembia lonarensis]|uniref:Peptidase M15 n=1 Tax=Cecembia lonarensis (strain CCUG 58316 / KCTC 22772 / LW9) TaxID=1225176 RepID=K1L6E3_CECL9|nr:D-Ala-D-Ala carboxypeptidase family metallohydrolase [Cecembia lonarensis]EKB47657.1 Peptidase M15 [Cecembia lonarensis LW9]